MANAAPKRHFTHSDLVAHYQQLIDQLEQLATQLADSPLPLWLPLSEAEQQQQLDPRTKAIELYCDLWHRGDGDARRTRSCHGLIAADPCLLQTAQAANQAKQQFRACLQSFKQDDQPLNELLEPAQQRAQGLRQALGHKGLSRLHLKQCYRLIPLVERHPTRVGLNWYTSGRSIKRISHQDAEQMLVKMGIDKPHIQLQLNRLAELGSTTTLAQVQTQAPLMRANLCFETMPQRQAMNLSLPLLFAYQPELPFPQHGTPSLEPQQQRQRKLRSDCRIEAEPFLPSLRIHRYC